METSAHKYYHYRINTPYGWEADEYRIFPVDISESEISRDWREAVSDYAIDTFDAFEDGDTFEDGDIAQFVADSLEDSYAEEICEEEYLAGIAQE